MVRLRLTSATSTSGGSVSAKTLGALAVLGLVIAFSLSSTLVKRAESPGVLVAFWRMVMVSVVWNVYLRSTGRRVTMRHVRQAFVPGVFFGLNLATFFAGATHNSVANAALIGSLSPFLIVPFGAVLFHEYFNPRALVFALVAFGGTVLVLLSAPANGDASVRGNVFGVLAMLLWTGYVVATRHFRRDMDVATFMATVCPIAAVAVLPLAIANGDVFGLSGTGWTYTLLLTFLIGVAAHGLMVYRPEDDPDRDDRDLPGGAARPGRRVVVPVAGRDAERRTGPRHRDHDGRPARLPGPEPAQVPASASRFLAALRGAA